MQEKEGKKVRVDISRLKGKIAEKGLTQESVAKELGVDNSTFIRKMKASGLTFSIGQMHKLVDILSITPEDAQQIFLSDYSQ